MRKAATIFVVAALAAFGAAACGDDEEDEATTATQQTGTEAGTDTAAAGGGETEVQVSAPESGEFAFDQESLNTPAGTATFTFTNPAAVQHDFILESEDGSELGRTDLITGGESDTVTVDVQSGTYTYYCDVPGHREGGMEGTLTVK
jgi:plastocyanin